MRYIDMRIIKCNKVKLVMSAAMLLPLTAQGGWPCEFLQLSARMENGKLIARLTNNSSQPMKIVGNRVSPIPGFGGFYIEVRRFNGSMVKYCGMIDNGVPSIHLLRPGKSVTYFDSVSSIVNQYCLTAGTYTAHVIYYNRVSHDGLSLSKPVRSKKIQFVVMIGYKQNMPPVK